MYDHVDARVLCSYLIHMARQESLVNGAMPLPEKNPAIGQVRCRLTPLQSPRVPHHHLLQRNSHRIASVAAEVLVRQKKNALATREGPLKGSTAIGRSANQPATLAT